MAQAREKETLKSLTQCKKKERAGTFSGYLRYCSPLVPLTIWHPSLSYVCTYNYQDTHMVGPVQHSGTLMQVFAARTWEKMQKLCLDHFQCHICPGDFHLQHLWPAWDPARKHRFLKGNTKVIISLFFITLSLSFWLKATFDTFHLFKLPFKCTNYLVGQRSVFRHNVNITIPL